MARREECVCTRQGEEGEADGTGTGTEGLGNTNRGSRGFKDEPVNSQGQRQLRKASHLAGETPRLRDAKPIKVKKLPTNFTEPPTCSRDVINHQVWESKLCRRDTWQMKLPGHLPGSIKCPEKDKEQDTQRIIQMLILKLGPS